MAAASSSRIWKTIKLGTLHKTADDFRAAFDSAGCYMGEGVHGILDSAAFHCADQEADINLVVRSVADLGFQRFATYEEISARAHELGLELCPAEVGPQLRLQYLAQPCIHWLHIAMEPVLNSAGPSVIFSVDSTFGGHYLGTRYNSPGNIWYTVSRFVFAKAKARLPQAIGPEALPLDAAEPKLKHASVEQECLSTQKSEPPDF